MNISQNRPKMLGFTMIELLIVISIIGILSGVSLNVINVQRQNQYAEDAVRRSTLEKIALATEAFEAAEGRYPTTAAEAAASPYINGWPDAVFVYRTAPGDFWVQVPLVTDPTRSFKYSTCWNRIMECSTAAVAPLTSIRSTCTGLVEMACVN